MLGVQVLPRLDGLCCREGADTIRTNSATKHPPAVGTRLTGLDYPSAEQVSRRMGELTVQQEYTSQRPDRILVTAVGYCEYQTARRLLTADAVRRLRQDELLIVRGNC